MAIQKRKTILSGEEKKICLCMIVKNEARIIERCLNAAKPILDFVSICDTGSDDETPEIIKKWGDKNNIPVTIHYKPFKNFGYNRTLAVKLAQETYPQSDYLLMLDADMILEVDTHFDKRILDKDHYLTMQYTPDLKFWLTRLLKTSLPWHSVGATHEYWDIDHERLIGSQKSNNHTVGKLEGLVVNDQGDGGSKADKFERDKRLLLEGLKDPTTPHFLKIRYTFYLAQTFMCLNQLDDAIYWYKKRVDAQGWEEEVFYSLLQIGNCYDRLANQSSQKDELLVKEQEVNPELHPQEGLSQFREEAEKFSALAIFYFQKAWEYRPTRAEPLYHLARMHREKGNNNLAFLYASQGKEIPFPKDDILFVDFHVYDYLFDYEMSISAFYVSNKRNLGRAAQKRLEAKIDHLPEYIVNAVRNNAKFY